MVRITEDLIRKRAEHNNCELSTLEEVSLHQQDVERIEHLDKWCRELKILYLQSNLIPKIENVGRLKKLEYLNMALNNVERIENLEGCESLKKLDLTVNFVGEISSIKNLKELCHLRELFLVGNPCAQFDGYRDYVIVTLPQLKYLDGQEIEKSERITAAQNYENVVKKIKLQEEEHRKTREKQKNEAKEKKEKTKKEKKAGFDGRWYTDINNTVRSEDENNENKKGDDSGDEEELNKKAQEKKDKEFWEEKTAFTPESRMEVHEFMQQQRQRDEQKNKKPEKPPRRLFADDGRAFNVNEPKIDFTLTDDDDNNMVLDLATFRFLDTSLIDVDVQTNYVRVVIKGKVFQLCLSEDVCPDSSSAKRSQVTGHLLITMPKAKPVVNPVKPPNHEKTKRTQDKGDNQTKPKNSEKCREEHLEVDPTAGKCVDIGGIVREKPERVGAPLGVGKPWKSQIQERANSEGFVDDPDVPPLH